MPLQRSLRIGFARSRLLMFRNGLGARSMFQNHPDAADWNRQSGSLPWPSLMKLAAVLSARRFVGSYATFLSRNSQEMLDRFRQASVAPSNNVPVGIVSPKLPKHPASDQIRRMPRLSRMPCLKVCFSGIEEALTQVKRRRCPHHNPRALFLRAVGSLCVGLATRKARRTP